MDLGHVWHPPSELVGRLHKGKMGVEPGGPLGFWAELQNVQPGCLERSVSQCQNTEKKSQVTTQGAKPRVIWKIKY